MKCVAKIMAMMGTRTAVADLCVFGLAACDERGPGFVNVSVRRGSPMRDELECGCRANARARIVTLESTATTRPGKGKSLQ